MLDSETRRRIDNARDILVGKVPDPKTQVEQITFALIYKFMDDMDLQSVSLGGKATFFANGYEQYAWSKLMDRKLGGAARMDLYVRALEGMSTNPHIPQLFRDIFKGAFMPYRDAETLNLFLKEMNAFTYAHSEDLGDAYEYLLSIFASQGKAGQFRTPRHIIDFIVDCVNPGKNDTVLDPACGTAGFLISAYKHIIDQNSATPLTGEEKKHLTGNFAGYDISPDMVRLSRVNMYLHQFPNPTIHEYDTLTYEDRWDETYDVILANPPFMTPKGGIRPHTRFAVKANRSEVLFVDYISEHLNPGGRAGVIVPEGIIFQSANAYKALRKMLVDGNFLVAVISLPAGIFQPYSGVKTSVLLLDKDLAKRTDKVLFVSVKADGYDLGAQRREIDKNDLPEALRMVKAFQEDPAAESINPLIAQAVSKAKLGADGEWNLSGERYKHNGVVSHMWSMVEIGDFCTIERGASPRPINNYFTDDPSGQNWIKIGDADIGGKFITQTNQKISDEGALKSRHVKPGDFILSNSMSFGRPYIMAIDGYIHDGWLLLKDISPALNKDYLYIILGSEQVKKQFTQSATGGVVNNLNSNLVRKVKIPLPPLEVQQAIVDEIEGYQKIIDGARQVVENYKPVIKIDPSWPLVKLGEVCETTSGGTPLRTKSKYYDGGTIPWLRSGEVSQGYITESEMFITEEGLRNSSAKMLPVNTVLVAMYGATAGQVGILKFESTTNQAICGILPNERFVPEFLYYFLLSKTDYLVKISGGGAQPNISQRIVKELMVPLPDIYTQKSIVDGLLNEQEFITGNKNLISIFQAKINNNIKSVWVEH